MSIAHANRRQLELAGDYPIQCNEKWFAVFPRKLEKLSKMSSVEAGDPLTLVIYRTNRGIERDHYAIPFTEVADLFDDKHLTHSTVNGSIRWNCTLKNDQLHVSRSGIHRDVAGFYGVKLSTESVDTYLAEELEPSQEYVEGRATSIQVNRYERDPVARRRCIESQGSTCIICGFSFESAYGEFMKGFIHVHHLYPLHLSCGERTIDPSVDLVPVCPNCHAVIHSKKPPLTIDEVRDRFVTLNQKLRTNRFS